MRYQDIPEEEVLEKIKERIGLNQMNLLVGAGMSCCACDLYKSWVGLISDMVAYLYPDELKQKGIDVIPVGGYYCHYELVNKTNPKDYGYVYNQVNSIVCREGVLAIPSMFEKRMGVRESIEAYIESHTPQIDVASNTISLFGKTCQIDKDKDLYFLTNMVNVGWNAIFTTNYDDLLKYASIDLGNKSLTECCDAATLSLRGMDELVVKLHGSIDFTHERNGFDGDVHRKYVLTQEDYNDYPLKHEAFMQLMKISLLKDCFCLVGFSGKDPNFVAWITWVRDILEAKKNEVSKIVNADDIKIFFIDCYDEPLDDATSQFFENHKIYRIILPEIKSLLVDSDSEPTSPNERNKWLFDSFFSTIKGLPKLEVEPKDVPESYTLWSKAYTLSGNRLQELTVNVPEAKELLSMRSYMRIVRGTHYQSRYIDVISQKSVLTELEAQLALLALEQQMYVGEEDATLLNKIKGILKDSESQDRLSGMENRMATLQNPDRPIPNIRKTDRVDYEKCLRLAFTFKFLELKEALDRWNPSADFIINKAVLLNLVDRNACRRMLTTDMLDSIPTRIERHRATQLANMLYGEMPYHFPIKDNASLFYTDLFSLRDWFFGKSLLSKKRVRPYGSDDIPKSFDERTALRSLQFLIETPTFIQIDIWNVVEKSQWYKVAHKLFEKYPYPVMFYSTTVYDEGMLHRIGQDYAYSNILHKRLPGMVDKMFAHITGDNVPLSFLGRKPFYVLLGELLKAVPPRYWNKYIMQLWHDNKDQLFADNIRNDELFEMLCSALSCTNDPLLISTVICDTLSLVRRYKRYDLAQNIFYYSRTKYNRMVKSKVEQSVLRFVDEICDVRDYILLGNINDVLNKNLITTIVKSIPKILNKSGLLLPSVNGLAYFAKRDKTILALVRKAIISSPSLWHNGVLDNGYTRCDFLPIVDIDNDLKWTKEELLAVYEKLYFSANQLRVDKDAMMVGLMNRKGLYVEMLRFIDLHRSDLQSVNFTDIYQQLDVEFRKLTSFEDIEKSLYSEDEGTFSAALVVLEDRIKRDGIKEYVNYINIIITRILCNDRNGYEIALSHLQYYVRLFATDKETIESIPRLTLLLDSLKMDAFKELEQNVITCSELTILMAKHLRKYGFNSEGVDYWINTRKSQFFNWRI